MIFLVALQLSFLVATSMAYSTGPRTTTCEDFHVVHVGSQEVRNENVTVTLRDLDGNVVNCWQPQGLYDVELMSTKTPIKGFMLQSSRGKFPTDTTIELPEGTRIGPCTDTVSHREALTSRSPPLIFGYKAPKATRPNPIYFRYTVVFDFTHHLENVMVEIPYCPPQPLHTTTSVSTPTITMATPTTHMPTMAPSVTFTPTVTPTPTPNQCLDAPTAATTTEKDFRQELADRVTDGTPTDPPTEPPTVSHVCGKNLTYSDEAMPYVQDDIHYTCRLNKTISQVQCQDTCEHEGRQLCCDVKNRIMRRKLFVCTACSGDIDEHNDLYQIYKTFRIEVTNSCKCWDCTDSN